MRKIAREIFSVPLTQMNDPCPPKRTSVRFSQTQSWLADPKKAEGLLEAQAYLK
jgi:hypothetical protein